MEPFTSKRHISRKEFAVTSTRLAYRSYKLFYLPLLGGLYFIIDATRNMLNAPFLWKWDTAFEGLAGIFMITYPPLRYYYRCRKQYDRQYPDLKDGIEYWFYGDRVVLKFASHQVDIYWKKVARRLIIGNFLVLFFHDKSGPYLIDMQGLSADQRNSVLHALPK